MLTIAVALRCARHVVGHPHARVDEFLACFGEYGVGCAVVGDGAAFAEHDNAVHVRCPDAHAVFYDEQGRAGGFRGGKNTVAHLLHTGGVEVGGGFVEDHGAGVHREDARQAEALLLTAGQRAAGVVEGQVVEPYCGEGFGDAAPDFFAGYAQVFGAERDVVADGCHDDGGFGVLLHHACGAACFGGFFAVDGDGAAGGFAVVIVEHTGDGVQERRFAGAGGAQQQDFFTGVDGEVESADDGFWASGVVPAEVVELDARPARCCFHDGSLAFVWLL